MAGNFEDYINYRVSKSDEAFKDAELLAENQRWNTCENRLYYAAFYLVSALLYKQKIKAHTHNGTKTMFFSNFIKTNKINKEFGKMYSTLFDWRQQGDYADFIDFDENTVRPILNDVAQFNKKLKQILFES